MKNSDFNNWSLPYPDNVPVKCGQVLRITLAHRFLQLLQDNDDMSGSTLSFFFCEMRSELYVQHEKSTFSTLILTSN